METKIINDLKAANISSCYFCDTAALLKGANALLNQCPQSETNASITGILEIAMERLSSRRLDPIIEMLETLEEGANE